MRDYRGKRLDTGEWIFGFFTNSPSGNHYITETVCGGASPKKVQTETVGECTGVFGDLIKGEPKPGDLIKRDFIYEGDIVEPVLIDGTHQGFSWGKQVAVFDRGAFCLKDRRGQTTPLCNYAANVQLRVLGNVHDNPELLEVME